MYTYPEFLRFSVYAYPHVRTRTGATEIIAGKFTLNWSN